MMPVHVTIPMQRARKASDAEPEGLPAPAPSSQAVLPLESVPGPKGVIQPPWDLLFLAKLYDEDPDVCVAVDTITNAVVAAGWEVRGPGGDGNPEAAAWLESLNDANPLLEDIRSIVSQYNLLSNSFFEITYRRGHVAGLFPMLAYQMRATTKGQRYFQVVGQLYTEYARYRPFHAPRIARAVHQFRRPSPWNRWYGTPRAYVAAKEITTDSMLKDGNLAKFTNGCRPQWAVLVNGGELTPDSKQAIEQLLMEHTGPENWSRPLILEAVPGPAGAADKPEITLQSLQLSPAEMDFNTLHLESQKTKTRAFLLPLTKAGLTAQGRMSLGFVQGEDNTFKYGVVQPQQTLMEQFFDNLLEDGGFTGASFKFREIDTIDLLTKSQAIAGLVTAGVLDPEEARAFINLGEGG